MTVPANQIASLSWCLPLIDLFNIFIFLGHKKSNKTPTTSVINPLHSSPHNINHSASLLSISISPFSYTNVSLSNHANLNRILLLYPTRTPGHPECHMTEGIEVTTVSFSCVLYSPTLSSSGFPSLTNQRNITIIGSPRSRFRQRCRFGHR